VVNKVKVTRKVRKVGAKKVGLEMRLFHLQVQKPMLLFLGSTLFLSVGLLVQAQKLRQRRKQLGL
jgi:hypothetical protein